MGYPVVCQNTERTLDRRGLSGRGRIILSSPFCPSSRGLRPVTFRFSVALPRSFVPGPASCDIPVLRRSASVLRPGACGAVRPFGAILPTPPTPHQSEIVGDPVSTARAPSAHTAADGHAARRPPDCSRSSGEGLPDSSPRPSAGSGRSQNDSCEQFTRVACHEMINRPCIVISWQDFPHFCPKYGHEMNNCCDYFISWRV